MADKKISELPLITSISGSIVFVPIVHDGITEKMTVDRFSLFTSQFSAHTGSAGNTFKGPQIIESTLSVTGNASVGGNASIGGNLVVNGKLTAQEVHTEITSASIIFESGSTIFGNSGDDTHQFTGVVSINGVSIGAGVINEFTASQLENDIRMLYITGALNAFTASQIGKDGTLAEVTSSLRFFYQTTSSLHAFTASQIGKDETLKVVTSSLNAFTASQIGKDGTLAEVTSSLRFFYQTTSSLHAFTASQIDKDGTLALVTSSLNDFTQSQIGKDETLKVVTSSLNAFTASQIGKDFTLSIVTSSLNNYTSSVIGQANTIAVFTSSINAFTGSQIGKDGTLAEVTSSLRFFYQTTSSLHAFTASQIGKDFTLSIVTSSIDAHILKQATQTGSQESINTTISIVTGSMRAEIGGIEAYTASLKSAIVVNGNNVRIIGELTASRIYTEFITSSVLFVTGSNIIGDQSTDKHEFTGSVHINDTLFIKGVAQGTGELNAFTGSQISKDLTLSIVTSSIDVHILKQATQTGSQDLVNLGISTFTGSLRSEVNLIEAYTASLKGAAIVSSSQQITNYYKFAETASANTFYGNQSITGSLYVNDVASTLQIVGNGFGQSSLISPNGALVLTPGLYGVQINGTYPDLQANGNITANGSVTGNIIATNNVVSSSVQITELAPLMAYTSSLKGQAIVSSSQQITNYYKFAETASANTFYGNQTISGNVNINGGNSVRLYESTNTNYWDAYTYTDNTLRVNYKGAGNDEIILYNDGGINFSGAVTASVIYGTKITTPTGLEYQIRNTNGASGDHIFKSFNTEILKLDGATNTATFADNIIMASGKGIDFSATSNGSGTTTSELLNDYEEGTWTPIVADASSGGNAATLTGDSHGVYTKIGRVVYFRFSVVLSSKASMTAGNEVIVQGFPFTSQTISGNWYNPNAAIIRNVTFTGYVQFHQVPASTHGYFRENVSNAAGDNIIVSDLTDSASMQVSGFYMV